ncbi:DUF3095 domain-containing protein [bacterium]|nr:DUF3095 domain-containing protein [bacterium]
MSFFQTLPIFEDFREAVTSERHQPVPADWAIIVSDVKGSTKAIDSGRYKEVNMAGAASIIAVQNKVGKTNVLFVFGGDGATFLVPSVLRDEAMVALQGTRALVQKIYGMDLRVGSVAVEDVRKQGADVRAGLLLLSPTQLQPILFGSGVRLAETLIKAAPESPLTEDVSEPDFTGLECRWEPLQNRNGEIVSLLVEALGSEPQARKTYQRVVQAIEAAYGNTAERSPVLASTLVLGKTPGYYRAEARARSYSRGLVAYLRYWARTYFFTQAVRIAWDYLGGKFGKRYRREVADQSDFRKFDGVLRMTLDGKPSERTQLEQFLRREVAQGTLVYGIESAPAALITCLVGNRTAGDHFHLIDGASGGYAKAAITLKHQLAALKRTAVA